MTSAHTLRARDIRVWDRSPVGPTHTCHPVGLPADAADQCETPRWRDGGSCRRRVTTVVLLEAAFEGETRTESYTCCTQHAAEIIDMAEWRDRDGVYHTVIASIRLPRPARRAPSAPRRHPLTGD